MTYEKAIEIQEHFSNGTIRMIDLDSVKESWKVIKDKHGINFEPKSQEQETENQSNELE